jgi:hypothetical protein
MGCMFTCSVAASAVHPLFLLPGASEGSCWSISSGARYCWVLAAILGLRLCVCNK